MVVWDAEQREEGEKGMRERKYGNEGDIGWSNQKGGGGAVDACVPEVT